MSFQADNAGPLPGWCQHHLAACPQCRQAAEATTWLVRRLERTAAGRRQPTPPFLAARVLSAARRAAGSRSPAPWRVAWTRFACSVGVASLVILAALKWWPQPSDHVASGGATTTVAQNTSDAATRPPFKLPDRASVLAYGARLDEPLEQEWQRMLADARTAARSLAAAFVPETVLDR